MHSNKKNGFSAVELLVVAALVGLFTILIGAFQSDVLTYTGSIDAAIQNQQGAQRVLRTFTEEVRGAIISDIGGYPVAVTSTSTLTFFANIDGDSLTEQITYYLDGDILKKDIVKPAGDPFEYSNANAETEIIVEGVVASSSLFTYYDETYDGETSIGQLSQPVMPTDVRLIRIDVWIDKDPNKKPEPFHITTQVAVRNLKISI